MKKKISLAGLILILILMFTGCGKSDTSEYDEETLQYYSQYFVSFFNSQTKEQIESYKSSSDTLLDMYLVQNGIPIEGDNFITMLDAWQAGLDECGALVQCGEFKMTADQDGATLTADAEFEDRDGTVVFEYDKNMYLESVTVSGHYSTGEILEKAVLNTILGMGTVFAVLIFLCFVIWLFKFIPDLEKKFRREKKAHPVEQTRSAAQNPVQSSPFASDTASGNEENDLELAAVIAAAVAAAEGISADDFVVRSIKRRKTNKWK